MWRALSARYTARMLRRSGSVRSMGIWLAIASVLLIQLLPTLSGLVGSARSAQWVELCRGTSVVWVNVADTASSDREPAAPDTLDHLFKHCPYCTLHVDMDVPIASALWVPLTRTWRAFVPAAFLQAPGTLHVWRAAQARAPPSQG